MNQLTIHGNITDKPTLRHTFDGQAVLNFTVAVNRRRFDRQAGQWRDLGTLFQRVVTFNARLADNAASIAKGTAVTVTGELADDSWTPEDGQRVQRTQLIAEDIAVSLRFASAEVTRNPREETTDTGHRDNVRTFTTPNGRP